MRDETSVNAEGRWSAKLVLAAGLAVGALTSCYVTPQQPQPTYASAPGPAPVQGGPPSMQGGPIEAGCSFSAADLHGGVGAVFQVACPPGCQNAGGLWGTDVYTADSKICQAAIHMGAMSPNGGVVTVRIDPGRPAYRGSSRNGVSSSDYGGYPSSFVFFAPQGPPQQPGPPQMVSGGPPPAQAPQAIEAGCSFNATQIRDAVGTAHLVSCPPNCAGSGGLWGTDAYTGDSGICRAAIHSGLITNGGGMVVVVLDVGRPAYRGSVRNGERSSDYGSYGSTFRLQPAR